MGCSAGSWAVAMDHLQEIIKGSVHFRHYWNQPIFLQFPTPVHDIHVTFPPNPDHDLVVRLSSQAMKFGGGCSRGETFRCHKRFCRSYFLDEHVVAQGCKLATKHDRHRFAAEVLNDVSCLIWENNFFCTGLYDGISSQAFRMPTSYQH